MRAAALWLAAIFMAGAAFAMDAESVMEKEQAPPAGAPDHGAWGELLDSYLMVREGKANLFDYGAMTAADREKLDRYIGALSAVDPATLDRDEAFAFWVNLYNAVTVRLIAERYPVATIRDIKPGFFSIGPWKMDLVTVNGRDMSLDDIEHGTLREQWDDNRVHYAVNCASIGCPDLAPEPYRGAVLDEMLDRAARNYVNDPRGVRIEDGKLTVSKIYKWYKQDFGGTDESVIAHLRRYADPALAETLAGFDDIDRTRYDWSLNDPEETR